MYDELPSIDEVVDLLRLPRKPGTPADATSYAVRCPFCGDRKYHMNIDSQKGAYYCFRCSGGEKGLGTLDLYARVKFGKRHERGANGNGKQLLASLYADLGKREIQLEPQARNAVQRGHNASSISIASDSKLNRIYSAMLNFPELALDSTHRENLKARGLDDQAIEANGYRSMPKSLNWAERYPERTAEFHKLGIVEAAKKCPGLKTKKTEDLLAGFLLARYLTKDCGFKLYGVPGTFKLAGEWMVLYIPGMLIPTRNMKGEIVLFQIRLDKGDTRYVTLSSKALPCAPKGRTTRTHFPLANAHPGQVNEVVLTEGALKADVAAHLYDGPVLFAAVLGTSNTNELPGILDTLKKAGVNTVQCAFDMDKICNRFVRKDSHNIERLVRSKNMKMKQMVWDRDNAEVMISELGELCTRNGVSYQKDANPFIELANIAKALEKANIAFCEEQVGKKIVKHYWCKKTKGIDDYLLSLKKTG